MKTSSEKIRSAVKAFGRQKDLAAQMSVTPQTVKMWIYRGRVSAPRLSEFCALTGMRPEDANPGFVRLAKGLLQRKNKNDAQP